MLRRPGLAAVQTRPNERAYKTGTTPCDGKMAGLNIARRLPWRTERCPRATKAAYLTQLFRLLAHHRKGRGDRPGEGERNRHRADHRVPGPAIGPPAEQLIHGQEHQDDRHDDDQEEQPRRV